MDPYAFRFEPVFLIAGGLAAVAYVRAARRERPPWWRIALFAAGLLLVVGAVNSPLESLLYRLLLIHLLQNVMLADWAPPLLLLGLTPAMRRSLAERGGRILGALARPRVALPLWLAGWYGIHLAPVYDFALRHEWALNLEHVVLLGVGTLFWWPVLAREARLLSTPGALAYLGAAFASSVFLGLAFIFASTPFYDWYVAQPRLWGLSAVKDQNLGGILMNAEQTIVFLGALVYFLLKLLEEEHEVGTS
ncbi:MAG: cytochrome c oxidase assembly protein [Actinomycetota bacterium]|nr:cytochrome c oxidase assembly protein [Actinomycetota bacterium]